VTFPKVSRVVAAGLPAKKDTKTVSSFHVAGIDEGICSQEFISRERESAYEYNNNNNSPL